VEDAVLLVQEVDDFELAGLFGGISTNPSPRHGDPKHDSEVVVGQVPE